MGLQESLVAPSVAFIVLSYKNSASELRELFAAFSSGSTSAGVQAELILVSNDDSVIPAQFPGVDVLTGHGNVGFAAGIRIGIKAANAQFVVISNPDVSISAQQVSTFLALLVAGHEVMVPVLRECSGRIAYASYEDWVFSGGRKIAKHVCREFLLEHVGTVLPRWVRICGAFVGMPTALAVQYGPFDDAFFMYGEDRDLTWRLRRDRVPIRLVREVSVVHIGGVSGSGMNRQLAIFRADSALRVAYRRYGAMGVFLKELDLILEACRQRGPARSHAFAAIRSVITHWGMSIREAPRLDFSHRAVHGV